MPRLIRRFDVLASTNDEAMRWAQDGAPHGSAVVAAMQTAGRGRLGRDWSSPPGKGLYLSVVLRPDGAISLSRLSIGVALASARAIEVQSGMRAGTKWPNDVLLHGRKIGGILCEARASEWIVAGIGLNLNFEAQELPPRPQFPATSLLMETGHTWQVEPMLQQVLAELDVVWRALDHDWPALRRDFQSRCAGIGQIVRVSNGENSFSGLARGVDDDGFLEVQTDKELRRVVASDVSYL